MSRSFAKFIKPFFKSYKYNLPESSNYEIDKRIGLTTIVFGTAILLGHCAYALGTVENKIIKLNTKYQFDRNGFTEFMIVDDNGNHYNINNSFWYWKWDSIEDWHKLEPNNDIVIKYYGWRVPLFGLFPNIIMSKQDKMLNSMSILSAEYRVVESKRNKEKQTKEITDDEKEEIKKWTNPYYLLLKKTGF